MYDLERDSGLAVASFREPDRAGFPADRTAIVGDVDPGSVAFALTDADGSLRADTVRRFDADSYATISSAMMAFKAEMGLASLPQRCALAVAGLARGDTISVTNSRWFVSRSGLEAILQRAPLVLNDFAAAVWAVAATAPEDMLAAGAAAPGNAPGTYLVIGVESGLGVAAFKRDEAGHVTVFTTEAGHSELVDTSPEISRVLAAIRRVHTHVSAEILLGARGLVAIGNAVAEQGGGGPRWSSAEDLLQALAAGDEMARGAAVLHAKALWRFAGNLTLIYGAWDGVFLTGTIVNALRDTLALPEVRQGFIIPGPFANTLDDVPGGIVLTADNELRGAAEALRVLP